VHAAQPSQAEKGAEFRSLHEGEPFLIPNPWDAGSARVLEGLGFKALAGTSSGFAFTLGRRDGNVTLDEVAEHLHLLTAVTTLPVSMDLENGYGPGPEDAATALRRAAEAGAVGGSIEDYDRETDAIYELQEAVERVSAAVEAASALDFPFTLTARAENQLHAPDLDDTIERLRAYEKAGADVLYAPGLRELDEVRTVCAAVEKPVNVLGHRGFSVGELIEAGAQRISVGGALAWTAMRAMLEAAERMRDEGDLSGLRGGAPVLDLLSE
jgi:2-methylisocitrate lyase-like PEP mutase family enzyme